MLPYMTLLFSQLLKQFNFNFIPKIERNSFGLFSKRWFSFPGITNFNLIIQYYVIEFTLNTFHILLKLYSDVLAIRSSKSDIFCSLFDIYSKPTSSTQHIFGRTLHFTFYLKLVFVATRPWYNMHNIDYG